MQVKENKTNVNLEEWNKIVKYEPILKAIKNLNFETPTEIQKQAIPLIVEQRLDLLGAAPTGSGKTLAFAIPIIRFIDRIKKIKPGPKLRALVVAPTRELVIQIKKHFDLICKYTDVTSVAIIGGMAVQKQERLLRKQPDIIIGTPGRLWELIEQDEIEHINEKSIKSVKFLVIDEFDKMIEKNHFEEMQKIIKVMLKFKQRDKRQILVFSATLTYVFKSPERWKLNKTKANKEITLKGRIKQMKSIIGMKNNTVVIDLTQRGIGKPSNDQLKEYTITCLQNEKDMYLYYILATCKGRTIIFCNSKDCVRRLISILKHLQLDCVSLHAELDQKVRFKNLDKFRTQPDKILVCSDVASRGLDIENVERVIHYQVPRTLECYVHRSGRTARGSKTGVSVILYEPKESNMYRRLINSLGGKTELENYPIDKRLFEIAKDRVKVVQNLNVIEHRLHKKNNEKDWYTRMANECEIDIEDRNDIIDKDEDNSRENLQVKRLENQLKTMLKTPISKYVNINNYLNSLVSQKITLK